MPSKAPAEQDFRKKRQPKESPKKVASDKATKALLGFRSKYIISKTYFLFEIFPRTNFTVLFLDKIFQKSLVLIKNKANFMPIENI